MKRFCDIGIVRLHNINKAILQAACEVVDQILPAGCVYREDKAIFNNVVINMSEILFNEEIKSITLELICAKCDSFSTCPFKEEE